MKHLFGFIILHSLVGYQTLSLDASNIIYMEKGTKDCKATYVRTKTDEWCVKEEPSAIKEMIKKANR